MAEAGKRYDIIQKSRHVGTSYQQSQTALHSQQLLHARGTSLPNQVLGEYRCKRILCCFKHQQLVLGFGGLLTSKRSSQVRGTGTRKMLCTIVVCGKANCYIWVCKHADVQRVISYILYWWYTAFPYTRDWWLLDVPMASDFEVLPHLLAWRGISVLDDLVLQRAQDPAERFVSVFVGWCAKRTMNQQHGSSFLNMNNGQLQFRNFESPVI